MYKRMLLSLILMALLLSLQSCNKESTAILTAKATNTIKGADKVASTTSMKIMVPAYFGDNSTYWSTMTTQASSHPGMIYAIINVNSGPGTAEDNTLLSLITTFRNAGGKILAYVNTWGSSTILPESTIKPDIDKWYSWYGSQVDGVFFDQMYPYNGGFETEYGDLYNYVKSKDANDMVVGNPGGNTSETYVQYNGNRITDAICTFEDTYIFPCCSVLPATRRGVQTVPVLIRCLDNNNTRWPIRRKSREDNLLSIGPPALVVPGASPMLCSLPRLAPGWRPAHCLLAIRGHRQRQADR